ncbi:MAG TPA: ABC transporter ATP-binding protein [Polyangia bacterium]|jgi:ATP-binding cassette subfamily B protein
MSASPPRPSPPPTNDREERPLDLGIIRRLFGYTRPYARLRDLLVVLVLLRSAQIPLGTWAVARIISGPISRHDAHASLLGVIAYLILSASTELTFVYRVRFALRLGEAVVHDLRAQIYRHLLRLPVSFFSRTPAGRLIARVTSDVDVVRTGVQDVAFMSIVSVGNLLVTAGLMLHYDWKLFLIVLVMAPGLWLLLQHFRARLSRAYRAQQESFSRVTASLAESVNGIREIQGFAREDVNGGLFGQLIHDHARVNMDAARHSAVFQPLLEFNGQLFLSLLLIIGGYRALSGDMPLATLIQFLFLSNAFFASIPGLGTLYNQALGAMAGAERIFALLDSPPEWQDAPDATDLPPLRGRIEFRGVTFAYQPDRPVLSELSFVAEPGQTLALVGHTGSGKSTIVNLIAKLYLPTAGTIRIDDRDLAHATGASLHRQIACVTQENFLYTGSVMENVRVGRPEASAADVREAARRLDVLDLIEALPAGFDTAIGERGAGLSLGQRQVICFLRALVAQPRILILDEATSSVDTLTEQRLKAALARLIVGRTSVIVAHRLSTIRHADQVLVLAHGRLVEHGTHDELVARGGRYADMVRALAASHGLAAPG